MLCLCVMALDGWDLKELFMWKKILFIRTVMIMDSREVAKIFLGLEQPCFFSDVDNVSSNLHFSSVFDMLNTTIVLVSIMEYSRWFHLIIIFPNNIGKIWSGDVPGRWKTYIGECKVNVIRTLTLLARSVYPRYICWWQISDWYPGLMRICEVMA